VSCVHKTDCPAGTFVSEFGSATMDRVCSECAVGSFSTDENQWACQSLRDCEVGSRIVTEGTATRDRVCERCPLATTSTVINATTCEPP
jgi:hypothetical protein